MFGAIARSLFGSSNDRIIKGLHKTVAAINAAEPEVSALSDEALKARTPWLKQRFADGESLDDLLVDAFATVREAAKRTLGQRHFDVQLMGGMILHQGKISEMRTGEGKTLVATLPVYLNALSGKGVHVVTVNDYLARRDSDWMGQIYSFLGLSVGCIVHGLTDSERQQVYACDVTYATNNELGFDYLRDNMKFRLTDMVQREFNFAIVDEVDSILVDEARTPLIISGAAEDSSELYRAIDKLIPKLIEGDFEKDEKSKSISMTDVGTEHMEALLREAGLMTTGELYDIGNVSLVHHTNQALKAHHMFQRDVDYLIKDDKVVIIDEFTGRMMEGRRYSEGLHQALEAKEGVKVQSENQTLASITFQNYFRLYPKLAGMTGTAMTEASEFGEIYGLDVVDIPTNRPCVRVDHHDEVYRTAGEKYAAMLTQIQECHARKQPVLVGTVSIEKSEMLSEMLKKHHLPHKVLNARHHEQEAYIIADAGAPGAITIATNMAGRGTDIQLGGNVEMRVRHEALPLADEAARHAKTKDIETEIAAKKAEALAAGGLFVIGTERHESRRIDNQLRGRTGRQGDPGASKFYLSLQDDLMRIFGSERMDSMLQKLGLEEGEAIIHPWVNKALEKAQQKVEARNFDMRKNLLKFDDVMNDQRKVIYEQRKDIMSAEEVNDTVVGMRQEIIDEIVARHIPEKAMPEQWNVDGLHEECRRVLNLDLPIAAWAGEEGIADREILHRIAEASDQLMNSKDAAFGAATMRMVEKGLLLQILDQAWKDHLLSLDHLRQGIGLRAYAQRDPLNEYKREAFNLFEEMLGRLREMITGYLSHIQIQSAPTEDELTPAAPTHMNAVHEEPQSALGGSGLGMAVGSEHEDVTGAVHKIQPMQNHVPIEDRIADDPSTWGKVARNEPCPCGSGKKYKQCHGAA